jgi:ribosomal protein S18 acetylase RimI-like enzyme
LLPVVEWRAVQPVRVWYLEQHSPERLNPARDPGPHVDVRLAEVPLGALHRFFYLEIGREHHWTDRLAWDDTAWQAYAERHGLELWIAYERGTPAGYCELQAERSGAMHLAYFGILPGMQGRGLGGWLLTAAIRRGWERDARRVTVNTCDLDAPSALPNYRNRGFAVVSERIEFRDLRPR